MTEAHFLSPLAPLIDAMIEDEGVELYVHYLDGVAYIKDDVGIQYPLFGAEWGATADELAEIVRRIVQDPSTGDNPYVHAGRHFRCRLLENDIIELRIVGGES
ncbi:MAG TPA: hypothetical protein VF885_01795 [Arthrobacter sp.]